ncbi:TlpA family protein disulfide reductase [Aquimarina sediminis]|uniref:TlpA family protein disulfide reductase n=1 Tax=Aquimarina sediminis TaxID=2070536 RepID=UPI000CA008E0|nr:deiodinase-like protein [Aquimarina sediminis]
MKSKKSSTDYNYRHFKATDYDFTNFKGPKAGEKYIDFEARTLDGRIVSLSNYLDKPIVLDTGSITCPMYANSKTHMISLQEQYPNIHFLLLYVREAHPGGKINRITSLDEKISNAKSSLKLHNEKRTILVDDLEGTAHQLYGAMPNMTYVIGTDSIIKFRANWTNIDALKKVLLKIDTNHIETQDYYPVVKPSLPTAIRTLMIGGIRALYEFIISLPQLIRQHKEVDSM